MDMEQRRRSAKITKRNIALPPIRRLAPIPTGVFEDFEDSDTDSEDELPIIPRKLTFKERQKKEELGEGKFRKRKRQQKKFAEFEPEITQDILDKFPSIPTSSLISIKRHLKVDNFKGIAKKNIIKDLTTGDLGEDICRGGINQGFIEETMLNKKVKGFAISFKGDYIAFVFYFEKEKEVKVELICVKKAKGTLKGVPLGQIIMEVIFQLTKSTGKKKVALEAVQEPHTLSFYRKLGFKKFGKTLKNELFLLKKTIK